MNNFLNTIKDKSKTYFLAFIGCLVVLSIFYSRFIRHRLPQNIPFDLTEFRFYALLCICISFIYIIKITIKPKNPHEYILNLRDYLSLPFSTLDNLVKTSRYSWLHIDQFLKSIYPKKSRTHIFLIIFLQLIPRIILISVFLLDVFYFHKLYYFYVIIFFGIFPWFYFYHKYSMYHAKELGVVYLETLYTNVDIFEAGWDEPTVQYEYDEDDILREIRIAPEWKPHIRDKYHEKMVTIREYLQILLEKDIDDALNDYTDDYQFDPAAYSKEYRYEQYEKITGKSVFTDEDYKILRKEFNEMIPILRDLYYHLYFLPDTEKKFNLHKINIVIYMLWFIAWSYILLKSFHTLNNMEITLKIISYLTLYTENMNPFI